MIHFDLLDAIYNSLSLDNFFFIFVSPFTLHNETYLRPTGIQLKSFGSE
jgi:hypothetical protein